MLDDKDEFASLPAFSSSTHIYRDWRWCMQNDEPISTEWHDGLTVPLYFPDFVWGGFTRDLERVVVLGRMLDQEVSLL